MLEEQFQDMLRAAFNSEDLTKPQISELRKIFMGGALSAYNIAHTSGQHDAMLRRELRRFNEVLQIDLPAQGSA